MGMLNQSEIAQRITQLTKQHFPNAKPEFTTATSLKDIGLDSLDIVDLVWTLEQEFGLKFTDDELQRTASLDALAALIHGHIAT